jgi:hypothetical protein
MLLRQKLVNRIVLPEQLRMMEAELAQAMASFREQINAGMAVQLPQYEGG